MKTKIKILCAGTALCLLAIAGCKKYEEGPSFSLRSKTSRLAGEWELEKYYENGVDKTTEYLDGGSESYKIDKDGDLTFSIVDTSWSPDPVVMAGKWEFISNKEELQTTLTFLGDSDMDTLIITKLKNKELWMKDKYDSPQGEYHYKAK